MDLHKLLTKNKFTPGLILLFICMLTQYACVPPTDRTATDVSVSFSDPTLKKIITFEDEGKIDSLYPYFKNKVPAYRYAAVKAFASIKDPRAIDKIIDLLKDPIIEVRAMAAFALGQQGDSRGESELIASFTAKDTLSVNNLFNKNILEALGKCGSKTSLKNIASVVSYRTSDDELLLGQMRSIYRFGQRAIFDDAATAVAINYATNEAYPEEVRLMAAQYLAKFKEAGIGTNADKIMTQIPIEDNDDIRMALVSAVGRVGTYDIGRKLVNQLELDKDYRVKCNIMRAISNFEFDSFKNTAIKHIKNPNLHVASVAADLIGNKGKKEDILIYRGLIQDSLDWKVRSKLYQAVMKIAPLAFTKFKAEVVDEIFTRINRSVNPYEKAALITALGNDPYQYLNIANLKATAQHPAEKVALVEAMGNIIQHPEFIKAYGSKYADVKYYVLNFIKEQCKTGDVGLVAAGAGILKKPELFAKEFIKDSTWIKDTRAKLKMPRDIEAMGELEQAESYFTDGKSGSTVPPKAQYNHPIDFSILEGLGDTVKIVMKTSKGNITMRLFTSRAPGSVANFVDLCKKDFFDNKVFHRVVPNFVIQAGCPRGDGYGALDYTIRSEFGQEYYNKQGLIGMASAGNDTEGTQFFITHSPTPHLDGKYTIFGEVVEGMDVVHGIYQGDKIIDAIILK
jgi:cyclophilin family peptidyl-prolyl cis-trans isomerase/HEAT repeat protein